MKISYVGTLAVFGVLVSAVGHAEGSDPAATPDQANAYYQSGDCQRATQSYGAILADPRFQPLQDLARFRKSYCHLFLSQTSEAQKGFIEFLRKHPDHDEAHLRLAQAYLEDEKFDEAIDEAARVKAPEFKAEAMIAAVRSHLEKGDPAGALASLRGSREAGDQKFLIHYWAGVTYYRLGNESVAKSFFESARSSAPAGSWVKSGAENWIAQINRDTRFFRGQVVLGLLRDTNLGQYGYQTVTTSGKPETASSTVDTAYTVKDNAYFLGVELGLLPYLKHPLMINLTFDFSSAYYRNNSAYNNQNYSVDLSITNTASYRLIPTLSLKYLDSRYNNVYYQDYLIFTPSVTWIADPQLNFRFSSAATQYLKYKHSTQVSPAATAKWIPAAWVAPQLNLSYSKVFGTAATYANSSTTSVSSGTAFSSYTTLGASLGATFYLPERIEMSGTVGKYSTSYAHEALPSGSTTGTIADRSDTTSVYSFDISRAMIVNLWTLGFSATFTQNRTTGYQGLPSGTAQANYNYDRSYLLLSNTLSF